MDLTRKNADSANRGEPRPGQALAVLFQPDALLNGQYLDSLRRNLTLAPEKQLMLALLEDAIETFHDNLGASGGKKRRLFEEAEHWIFGADSDRVFSFASVCGALGLDPDYVRKGVDRWQQLRRNAESN